MSVRWFNRGAGSTRSVSTIDPTMSKFPSESKVQICGVNAHDCGYCKSEKTGKKNTSVSYGFVSETMTVEDYQSLMLLGWRRSGKYFYKPIMNRTCCPQYPIRLRVNEHKQSKSQKKVMKNVEKYLAALNDDLHIHESENGLRLSSEFTFTNPNESMNEPISPKSGGPSQITIELDTSAFTEEKFALYKQYQIDVHKDKPEELKEQGFKRFLCESPLKDNNISARPSPSFKFGTFHQLYRLNGKLIAVGVVDLLPLGLSSVYVFYDNSYKQLSLGKYTALKEIEFCRTHHFAYYFMGFYIHTCEKMRYKGEYKPSDLLCPTTFQWYPLQPHCVDILSKFNFSPFEPTLAARRALVDADVGNKGAIYDSAVGIDTEEGEGEEAAEIETAGGTKEGAAATSSSTAGAPQKGDGSPEKPAVSSSNNSSSGATSSAPAGKDSGAKRAENATSSNNKTASNASKEDNGNDDDSGSDGEGEGEGSDGSDEEAGGEEGADVAAAVLNDVNLKLLDEFAPLFSARSVATNTGTSSSSSTSSSASASAGRTAAAAAPTSPSSAILTNFQAVKRVPLDVGVGVPISVTQLRPEGIKQLSPFLEEWISYVGPDMGAVIAVSLV